MAGDLRISLNGGDELEKLAKRLRQQKRGDLQKQLTKNIRRGAKPVLPQLRSAVHGVEVRSSRGGDAHPNRSTGLRARVARALRITRTAQGVRYIVAAREVDPQYGASLPRYLDGEIDANKRWRHPVFGDRETWAMQHGQPWFFTTIRANRRRFEKAVRDAMDAVARELTK